MKCSSAKPLESKWDHLIKEKAGGLDNLRRETVFIRE